MASSLFAAVASDWRASSPELEIMSPEEYYAYVREVYDTLTEMIKDGKEREAARNKAKNTSQIVEQPKRTDDLPVSTDPHVSSIQPPKNTLMMQPVHSVATDLEMLNGLPLGNIIEQLVDETSYDACSDSKFLQDPNKEDVHRPKGFSAARDYYKTWKVKWKKTSQQRLIGMNTVEMKKHYSDGKRITRRELGKALQSYGLFSSSVYGKELWNQEAKIVHVRGRRSMADRNKKVTMADSLTENTETDLQNEGVGLFTQTHDCLELFKHTEMDASRCGVARELKHDAMYGEEDRWKYLKPPGKLLQSAHVVVRKFPVLKVLVEHTQVRISWDRGEAQNETVANERAENASAWLPQGQRVWEPGGIHLRIIQWGWLDIGNDYYGHIHDIGCGNGRDYSLNVPLDDGFNDESYHLLLKPIMGELMGFFRPDAVVLQCGADSLFGDRVRCLNFSIKGHVESVKFMRSFIVHLLLSGVGGYAIRNVAGCWPYEIGAALGVEVEDKMPKPGYYEYFSPDDTLHIALSVQIQEMPPETEAPEVDEDQLKDEKLLELVEIEVCVFFSSYELNGDDNSIISGSALLAVEKNSLVISELCNHTFEHLGTESTHVEVSELKSFWSRDGRTQQYWIVSLKILHLEDKVCSSGESKSVNRRLALFFIFEIFHYLRPPERRSGKVGSSLIMSIKILFSFWDEWKKLIKWEDIHLLGNTICVIWAYMDLVHWSSEIQKLVIMSCLEVHMISLFKEHQTDYKVKMNARVLWTKLTWIKCSGDKKTVEATTVMQNSKTPKEGCLLLFFKRVESDFKIKKLLNSVELLDLMELDLMELSWLVRSSHSWFLKGDAKIMGLCKTTELVNDLSYVVERGLIPIMRTEYTAKEARLVELTSKQLENPLFTFFTYIWSHSPRPPELFPCIVSSTGGMQPNLLEIIIYEIIWRNGDCADVWENEMSYFSATDSLDVDIKDLKSTLKLNGVDILAGKYTDMLVPLYSDYIQAAQPTLPLSIIIPLLMLEGLLWNNIIVCAEALRIVLLVDGLKPYEIKVGNMFKVAVLMEERHYRTLESCATHVNVVATSRAGQKLTIEDAHFQFLPP